MEFFFELIAECALELITDSGVDVMTGSENTHNWPKGVKIALVAITLLVFLAVTGFLLFVGITSLIKKEMLEGIVCTAIGVIFFVSMTVKFIKVFRQKKR